MIETITGGLSPVGLLAVVVALCGATVMLRFSATYPDERGPQFWAPGYMLVAVSIVILVIRSPQQDLLAALGGSAGFVLGYLLLWAGYLRFLGRRIPWAAATVFTTAYLVALAWFGAISPQPALRVGATSLAIALLTGATCYALVRDMKAELLQSQALTAMLFGAFAVATLLRALLGMTGRLIGTGFADGPLGYGVYLMPALVMLIMAGSTGMMLAQRRRAAVNAPASGAGPTPPRPASPSAAGDPPPR